MKVCPSEIKKIVKFKKACRNDTSQAACFVFFLQFVFCSMKMNDVEVNGIYVSEEGFLYQSSDVKLKKIFRKSILKSL